MSLPQLYVFRTYPRPGTSWKPWSVELDGLSVGTIGGAGVLSCLCTPGNHCISVLGTGGVMSRQLSVTVPDAGSAYVVVSDLNTWSDQTQAFQCEDPSQLPRSAVPRQSPSGQVQSYATGLHHARVALASLVSFGALMVTVGIGCLVAIWVTKTSALTPGLLLGVAGGVLLWRLRPGMRLLRNQRGWPLPDRRVERKGDELVQWRETSQVILGQFERSAGLDEQPPQAE
jgi:hypothetical protein